MVSSAADGRPEINNPKRAKEQQTKRQQLIASASPMLYPWRVDLLFKLTQEYIAS
jgi:hypothetical protein